MKIWVVVLLVQVASTVAQYGIPDDDDDDLPPASYQFQPDTLLSSAEAEVREATPAVVSSYTKYEDETYDAIVQMHNPSMLPEPQPQSPVLTEPIRIAVEQEPARAHLQTIEENIVFTQQHRFLVPEVRTVDKPAVVFSTVVDNTPAQVPTQINFADDSRSSGHDFPTSSRSEAIPIVKYIMDNDNRGTFRLETESADGTFKTMSGQLKHVSGSEGPVVVKTGSYRYTGDDGKVYQVDWKADEGGFQAFGDHLPTLPSSVQISF